ncbi:hypothetical protein [Riemerella anatipestifer]|uniref:hypothetical protein n=1 Tax=Riemerella anatipestifer TaxID=34085 RepID=UPI0016271C62|nr:hypothetical protein [Riemerella anatipestifer]
MNSQLFDLAEHTNPSLFLTEKAGTDKTTFLNHFVKNTQKTLGAKQKSTGETKKYLG